MKKYIVILLFCISGFVFGGEYDSTTSLRGMARELWGKVELASQGLVKEQLSEQQAEDMVRQAVIWLEAAERMDNKDKYVLADLQYLYRSEMVDDPGRAADALKRYSDLESKDSLCVSGWMNYCLDKLNQQAQRKAFIDSMLENLIEYPDVQSNMVTMLGNFSLETGDADKAAALYEYAWQLWSYNLDASARLNSLPAPEVDDTSGVLTDEQISQVRQQIHQTTIFRTFYHLILTVAADPGNPQACMNLADMLFSLNKYDSSADFYKHCLKIIEQGKAVSTDGESSFAGLRLKYAIACYNAGRYEDALAVVRSITIEYPNEIPAWAFAVLASAKVGDKDKSEAYLADFTKTISQEDIDSNRKNDIAWFYAFAVNDTEKAGEYLSESDEGEYQSSIAAYVKAVNGQAGDIEDFIKTCKPDNALALFAVSCAYADKGELEQAYKYALMAKDANAGALYSFVDDRLAELAKLLEITEEYKEDMIDSVLNQLDVSALDIAFTPDKFIQCIARAQRNLFEYDEMIVADLSVTNISSTDIVVGPSMYLDPYLYVVAEVVPQVGGKKVPAISVPIGLRYLGQKPLLRPGFSNSFSESLCFSELDNVLSRYPQVDCEVSLKCYPMPYVDENGNIKQLRTEMTVQANAFTRKRIGLTAQRLTIYHKMLKDGMEDEKVKAAKMFCGLLKEARLAAAGELPYVPKKINYSNTLASVLENLKADEPMVRAWTVCFLEGLMEDKSVVNGVSALLKDPDWQVRLMALNALYGKVKIDSVIKWFAENETDPTVLRQVQLWQGEKWETKDFPFEFPPVVELEKEE